MMDSEESDTWTHLGTVTPFDELNSRTDFRVLKQDVGLFSPSSILIESLIEQICSFLEKDEGSRKKMYLSICRKLNELNLIDKSYLVEDFNFIRNHYRKELYRLVTVGKSVSQVVQDIQVPSPNVFVKSKRTHGYGKLFEWSRYSNEFVELEFIARGGFGEVVKVRNKLDASVYAIKKICLKYCSINGFIRGLSEVQMLAKLNHPNIVSYKAAWLEPLITVGKMPKESKKALCDAKSDSKENESSDIVFLYSNQSKNENPALTDVAPSCSSNDVPSSAISENEFLDENYINNELLYLNNNENKPHKHECGQEWAVLFIQMQLCNQTLKQWLDMRNNRPSSSINVSQSMYIFTQVIKGIEFIHSKGIVHHDIKSNNIFISHDEKEVQIGDFGLSCCLLHDACPDQPHASTFSVHNCPVSDINQPGEIGTKLYAAPEQLSGICSPKSDLYSLGIILFELMYIFHTDMERIKKINELRKGILPKDFLNNFSRIAQLIKRLVTRNVDNRPTATELLKEVSEMIEFTECIDERDQTIRKLRQELCHKDELIAALTKKLSTFEINRTQCDDSAS